MKKLFLWLLLLINGSMVAMFCGCLCEDDEEPRSTVSKDPFRPYGNKVLQKCVIDSDNYRLEYWYNRLSHRWNLISKRGFSANKEDRDAYEKGDRDTYTEIEMIYYVPSEYYGWADKWEYYREYRRVLFRGSGVWESSRKLLEMLPLEQYYGLDLKENGQFVTGAD